MMDLLHFKDGKFHSAVSFYKGANAYEVYLKDNAIKHDVIKGVSLK